MTRFRLAAPVALLYWLMLVAGLGLFTALRIAHPWEVIPLWVGAVGGTALGQFLALRDYRLWIAIAFIIAVLTWCVPVLPPELSSTALWMAFVPATLCGWFCLADRASLAAFWFPTVIWMLSILDRTSGQAAPDGAGIVLLGGLAVLFIVFLRLRESRRVALWRTVAAAPLAAARPSAVRKEPPGRQLARGGWALLVSAITFGVTAWVAPLLWQTEAFDGGEIPIPELGATHGLPCCPVAYDLQEITRPRVSEYFDLGRGHDEIIAATPSDPTSPEPSEAVPETDVLAAPAAPAVEEVPAPAPMIDPQPLPPAPVPEPQVAVPEPQVAVPEPQVAVPEPQAAVPEPQAAVVPAPQAPELAPATPPPARVAPSTTAAASPTAAPASVRRPHRPASAGLGPQLLHWIAAIVAAALVFQLITLALRPLRRLITLRHLRRPFWDETIDQRVSNSWQLALVGLRDAGWRSTLAEAPREFARRVGVDGLERCATILERARHGLAIDALDLSEMATSADAAYRSARHTIAPLARTLAWVRWPLT